MSSRRFIKVQSVTISLVLILSALVFVLLLAVAVRGG